MRRYALSAAIALVMVVTFGLAAPALAQEDEPADSGPDLMLYTPYPAQVIDVGENLTLNLHLRTQADPGTVALSVEGLPENWVASFRGEARTVQAVFVQPDVETSVELRVEVPEGAEPGTYDFTVVAEGDGVQSELPLQVIIEEQMPASLALKAELPVLRGKPTTTFRYNLTVQNEGDEDLVVNFLAETPQFFSTVFKSGTQEVTSIPLEANASERIAVEVNSTLDTIPAGSYPFTITAQSDETQASMQLVAEVVGEATIRLTTPDSRLSGEARAGEQTTYRLLVQNNGSAQAHNISLGSTPPRGWEVTFEPESIEVIEPGEQIEVTARVQPPEQALAGDYMITFRATPEGGSSKSVEYRITVRTSTLWGVAGIGLVAVAVGVVGVAVSRFGRR